MINIIHSLAIITGVVAYYFSDVNSNSGFSNTLLPLIALFSFIYGVIVTVNIFYTMRHKSDMADRSADLLFESMKELGKKESGQQKSHSGDSLPDNNK